MVMQRGGQLAPEGGRLGAVLRVAPQAVVLLPVVVLGPAAARKREHGQHDPDSVLLRAVQLAAQERQVGRRDAAEAVRIAEQEVAALSLPLVRRQAHQADARLAGLPPPALQRAAVEVVGPLALQVPPGELLPGGQGRG